MTPVLLDSFDVIVLQEHWLSQSELSKLCFSGFVTTAILGFDNSVLLRGRPFGGCAILYRQCLVSSIKQIRTCSSCFCAVNINFRACCCLFVNIYLPTDYCTNASTELLKDTLGEISGFISSSTHDFVVVVGDWNTDMRRPGRFSDTVASFLSEFNFTLVDLNFPDDVGFTYLGHDDSKSWLDHVAVSNHFLSSVVSVHSMLDGRNLSDHNPLAFSLDLSSVAVHCPPAVHPGPSVKWHLATSDNICNYQVAVQCLLDALGSYLTDETVFCCTPSCSDHQHLLEEVGAQFVSGLKAAADSSIPSSGCGWCPRVAGWSQFVRPELETSHWWYKLWLEAGSPSAGVLFKLKKTRS